LTGAMHERDVRTLIRDAAANGVRLWVEKGRLVYEARESGMPATLRAALQSRREDLIGELSQPTFRKAGPTPKVLRYPPFWKDWWEETQANPEMCHGTHLAIKLTGEIGLEPIESALKTLTSRHDLLRSRARLVEEVPCLLEHSPMAPAEVIDVSTDTAAEQSPRVQRLVRETIYAPFEDGLLYRARVIKISDKEYVVAIALHHFVADEISCAILGGELLALLLGNHDPGSAPPQRPLQYSDYLLAMSEWLAGEGLRYRLAYWIEKMRGAPPVRFPPACEPCPAGAATFESISMRVNEVLRAGLARAAKAARVPFAAVFLAAHFTALMRTLKSSDLAVIMIHSGRDDPALLGLVGFTVNCFPVRVSVLPEMSYGALLRSVNDTYLLARDYQIPWALLMRSLGEIGVSCIAPIFNYVAGGWDERSAPSASRQAAGLQVERLAVDGGPAGTNSVAWKSFDCTIADDGKGALVTVRYMPSRYQTAAFEEFANAYLLCLEAIAADPARSIG
jgi:Condensation domain/TubC N-terminal docking domain